MSNELAIRVPGLALRTVDDVARVARMMAESGYFKDAKDAAQAGVKIMAGQGWGIQPFDAMSGVHVIQGKPVIGAGLMAAKVKGSGKYDYRVRQMTSEICELEFFQGNESIGTSSFTIAEAKAAGTQNLSKFPRNMLFARAISNGVKWFCPDVFTSPVYVPEDFDLEVDADGTIIDAHVMPSRPQGGEQALPQAEVPEQTAEAADSPRSITDKQLQALSIAVTECKFGTDTAGKSKGRAFVSWLAGIDPVESIKDLTLEQAAAALDRIGGVDQEGKFRTDKKRLIEERQVFEEELEYQASVEALGEPPAELPDFEPDAVKARKVKGAPIDAEDADPVNLDKHAITTQEVVL